MSDSGTSFFSKTDGFSACSACEPCLCKEEAQEQESRSTARSRFARFVKTWLEKSGHPLKKVSQEIGVAESTVSQWANGRRFPKIEQLEAFSQLSAVPLPCLLCERNADYPSCEAAPPAPGLLHAE